MVGKAQKNKGCKLIERAIAYENANICVVCNKKMKKDKLKAMKVDGFWICSSKCIDKFLKARRMWTTEEGMGDLSQTAEPHLKSF